MSDAREPAWHWDEQRALRELLAEQAEGHADELARAEKEIAYWRRRAELAEARGERMLRLLAHALGELGL